MLSYLTKYYNFYLFSFHHRAKRHFLFSSVSVGALLGVLGDSKFLVFHKMHIALVISTSYSGQLPVPPQFNVLIPFLVSFLSFLHATEAIAACCSAGFCSGQQFWETELKLQGYLSSAEHTQQAPYFIGLQP